MHFLHTFNLTSYLDGLFSYALALILGALIGAERQYRQRTAGLRTNALVALGASAFVDLAQKLGGDVEAVRVISYTVSGIGFLGAGVIMKEGMNVRGLNTAATLWCSAAGGSCAGTDMAAEAATLAIFVVVGNTLLRPVVNAINRIPLASGGLEATHSVLVTTEPADAAAMRDVLIDHLELMRYPVADTEIVERSDAHAEIRATLVSTAAADADLDGIVAHLSKAHGVQHASWGARRKIELGPARVDGAQWAPMRNNSQNASARPSNEMIGVARAVTRISLVSAQLVRDTVRADLNRANSTIARTRRGTARSARLSVCESDLPS